MYPLLSLALRPLASKLLTFEQANFSTPIGEPAIVPPDSVSWRVFSNVVTVYVGGVAAVLLELGDAQVRAGVWEHSSFRDDPRARMHSTGGAAMVTVFAARSEFEALAQRVNAIHSQISGRTPDGTPYRADDPELLLWVHATASFAFLSAYTRLVRPLEQAQRDLFYREAALGGQLYGVADAPRSEAEIDALFTSWAPRLTPSPVIAEFLEIMRTGAILPPGVRPLQRLIVRAAVGLIPPRLASQIGITEQPRASVADERLLKALARIAGRLHFPNSPWALAAQRLGLPRGYVQRVPIPATAAQPRS